jgi:alanine racemase
MPRPIKANIHIDALRHNLTLMRGIVNDAPGGSNVWAVIKANAYGHGVRAAVAAFDLADGLALLDIEEAAEARAAGWTKPILLLEGPFEVADWMAIRDYQLTPVIHHPDQLAMLQQTDLLALNIYLKLDTGMSRLGLVESNYRSAFEQVVQLQTAGKIKKTTLMTHFACADRVDGVDEPLRRFLSMASDQAGIVGGQWCLSNSAACLTHAEKIGQLAQSHQQGLWSRPGICLYGASPLADRKAEVVGLKPAMTLRSELISVKSVQAGEGVGYGHTFVADHPMRIGVVACGYADGYPRHAPTGTPIAVNGQLTRLIGRVSMDMIMVDLGDLPDAGIGAEVVLWGAGGASVDTVADSAGTIGYELLSGVTARVPRVVVR